MVALGGVAPSFLNDELFAVTALGHIGIKLISR